MGALGKATAPYLDPLAPEARRLVRRMRFVYPPELPGRSIGLFSLVRYATEARLRGDVVECGVGRGVSYFLLAHAMHATGHPGRLYGYDSFEGFPEPTAADASARMPRRGEWADTSIEHVRGHFASAGLGAFYDDRCRLVRGFFKQSLQGPLPVEAVSLLHLDVDLYESYLDCGRRLGPLVEPGGIVLLDEYAHPNWPGATKAVDALAREFDWTILRSDLMDKHLCVRATALAQPFPALAELLRLLRSTQVRPEDRPPRIPASTSS